MTVSLPAGLSQEEATRRLAETGPNDVPTKEEPPLLRALRHFWSPVPWMLEITIALQLAAGERLEASMVGTLLLINVLLGIVQEGRASATLSLLRQRLAPKARLSRDGRWTDAPAAALVLGDIVQLSLGGVVPADVPRSLASKRRGSLAIPLLKALIHRRHRDRGAG